MFDNIAKLKFVKGPNNEMLASAMVSSEGECMDFRQQVTADGRVEDWMTDVLNQMRKTNRLITKEAVFFYGEKGKTRYERAVSLNSACVKFEIFCLLFPFLV